MSKLDKTKEEISILRDEYKNYFIVIMTILTGSITAFYQVLISSKPIFVLFIATFGIILSVFIAILFKKKRLELDEKLEQLEEL